MEKNNFNRKFKMPSLANEGTGKIFVKFHGKDYFVDKFCV